MGLRALLNRQNSPLATTTNLRRGARLNLERLEARELLAADGACGGCGVCPGV